MGYRLLKIVAMEAIRYTVKLCLRTAINQADFIF